MKTITSNTIGELEQSKEFEDWWESKPVAIPFLNGKKLKITFTGLDPEDDPDFIREADQALSAFLAKTAGDRLAVSDLAYQHCMDFLQAVGYDEADQPLWEIKEKSEIWNFIYPQDIYLSRRHRRDKDVYLNLTCECEWEQEHGLQFVFRQGSVLTRVSDQDGHLTEADAYGNPDAEDELRNQLKNKEKRRPWWKRWW